MSVLFRSTNYPLRSSSAAISSATSGPCARRAMIGRLKAPRPYILAPTELASVERMIVLATVALKRRIVLSTGVKPVEKIHLRQTRLSRSIITRRGQAGQAPDVVEQKQHQWYVR